MIQESPSKQNTYLFTLCYNLLILFGIYSTTRFFFFLYTFDQYSTVKFIKIVLAFFKGLRFDASAIFTINALYIFAFLLPFDFTYKKKYSQFLFLLFIFFNLPFFLLNWIDNAYFSFTLKRTTIEVLKIHFDIRNQITQLCFHYWDILVLFLLSCVALIYFYRKPETRNQYPETRNRILSRSFILLVALLFSFLLIRGGIQIKPLKSNHAFTTPPLALGSLTLNTPFTFINSLDKNEMEKIHYFSTDKEAMQLIQKKHLQNYTSTDGSKNNIVILIMESLSSEYMGYANNRNGLKEIKSLTPFLDSLAEVSLFFENSFANGMKSIDALPAILASMPVLMDEPYITSLYHSNIIHCAGEIFKNSGYHTSFFHGGKNGTMWFDTFSGICGIENYFGMNEYHGDLRDGYDGNWGIYDEPFLQFAAKKLKGFKSPFFTCIFTLSSHQPYKIPPRYLDSFPEGKLKIHRTIQYADFALKEFFKSISSEPWFNNTLFVITGDHTNKRSGSYYNTSQGQFRVPILFYKKNKIWDVKIDRLKLVKQTDILPSIIDYCGIDLKTNKFGLSVFDSTQERDFINMRDEVGIYFTQNYFLITDIHSWWALYDLHKDSLLQNDISNEKPEIVSSYIQKIEAYKQYHNNSLIDNSL